MIRGVTSLTLVELLIAIILLSIIALGITSIDIFSHFHVIGADRRARLQNEVSIGLEHMAKQIARAIGSEIINGADTVIETDNIAGNPALWVYIDSNATGGPGDGRRDTVNDRWIAYRLNANQIWYCPQCTNIPCTTCNPGWTPTPPPDENIISRNIVEFIRTKPVNGAGQLNENFITLQLSACWDPVSPPDLSIFPNGTVDNPCVRMTGRAMMPSISTN